MHPAFSRFTRLPEGLREAGAYRAVPGAPPPGMGRTAAVPEYFEDSELTVVRIKREGGMSQQHAALKVLMKKEGAESQLRL